MWINTHKISNSISNSKTYAQRSLALTCGRQVWFAFLRLPWQKLGLHGGALGLKNLERRFNWEMVLS